MKKVLIIPSLIFVSLYGAQPEQAPRAQQRSAILPEQREKFIPTQQTEERTSQQPEPSQVQEKITPQTERTSATVTPQVRQQPIPSRTVSQTIPAPTGVAINEEELESLFSFFPDPNDPQFALCCRNSMVLLPWYTKKP